MKRDSDRWTDKIAKAQFVEEIRYIFDFLCSDYNFKEPITEQSSLTLTLSYHAEQVAVEISVDFRDSAVEVALVWLIGGKRPDGWKNDTVGRQFMIRLYEAAWHRKVPNPKVSVPKDSSPKTTLRLWLKAWEEQLRTYFFDVLHDSDKIFHELNEKKSR